MKKRILSFLLALLMVVSIFPAPAFATDSTDATITPTETPTDAATEAACPTCGTVDCTSDHTNWCADCKKDNCGQTHVFCETCKKNDCGVDHTAELLRIPMTSTGQKTTETQSPDYSEDVGKYVKLNEAIVKFTVYGLTPSTGTLDEQIFMHEDFLTDTIFQIAEWMMKDGKVWYRLTFYKGGLDNNSNFAQNFPAEPWFMQTAANELVFIDTCSVCGKPDCSGHTWCDICEEYDCGKDHTQPPVEPENPCDCGCENCTGAEDCPCQCGKCSFCEKKDETTVPSISASINDQTITVSGNTLPENATLLVEKLNPNTDVLLDMGIPDGSYALDISVFNEQGQRWQPADGEAVTLRIPVPSVSENSCLNLIHVLDKPDEVRAAIANGSAVIANIAEYSEASQSFLSDAIVAWQQATGSNEMCAAAVIHADPAVIDGYVVIETSGFSYYIWSGSYYSGTTSSGYDKDNKVKYYENIWGSTAWGNEIIFVPRSNVYVETGINNRAHWEDNSSYVTEEETGEVNIINKKARWARFLVASNAPLGHTFTITATSVDGKNNRSITYVVIEERTVYFNANGGSCGTTSDMAITDGGSRNDYVYFPSASRIGYIFQGWYTAASGGSKVGDAGAAYMPGSNGVPLYAQWTANNYTVKFDSNTANAGGSAVTGSMSNLSMTYDVETTLPRNQFVNQGDGMVFLGWATSPTGDVVYKDGAKIKNLTATNNGTVTLYAKWKYGLASTVYIGINNTYHNPKGTYTAGGVTINSYHTYPNEPAQMTGDFDRVTDTSGGWTYNSESAVPLKNQAASYINGNIFNSPDYEMTYVEGENTLGIADPTGEIVRAMLKFSEADYQAMIAAWLNGMRSALAGYGDTSVDWQNAKPEDFVMVPYVIKFQNYDSWYIDMVVKPKALYTLAYDGNIENGYTASFTGVAFPPSAQHTEGTNVSVVSTPIGYQNNNLKVTKVIDGHTYTAEFQYWYDAKGNTYGGSTGRNTITLTEDTILYAKWDYPDASYGNLNITKNVVDKDAYEDPSATQTFTFIFTTSDAGSYSYTIYDRAANVKTTGTIANNGTFTLQDGWRIRITDLPKDATYTVTETAVDYYTASGTVSGTISAGATTYATVTNTYQKNAGYTVKHYLQNNEKTGYIEQAADQQNLYGTIGQNTSAQAKTYSGYTVKTFSQAAIKADGSTEISIYYDLVSAATVTWKNWDGTILETDENVAYGTEPSYDGENPEKDTTAQYTYTFDGWDPTPSAVTGDATYTAKFKETVNQYTLSGEIDHGTVTGPVTVDYGKSASITFTPSSGYAFVACKIDNDEPDEIPENAPKYTVINNELKRNTHAVVTTKLINYTIKYELVGGNLGEGVTNPATYTIETETFTLNNPTRAGYKFKGWATSENATTGTESITIAKGTTGNKTYYAVWERSLVDLTIKATTADTNQNLIFTVSGTRSDGAAFAPIDVVLCSENNFQVTIKDMPVGEYTVTEKDGWSWREESVDSKTADLRTTSQTVPFDFDVVDDLHWLSGYSYKRKKGGS